MRQISASELREIATDIESELNKLKKLTESIYAVQIEIENHPDLANIFYESMALKLHNFYTGCERIFQIIASELNGGLPSSYDWHRRLLQRMAATQDERPALITEETAQKLQEYLAFRHIVRNIYGFELEPQRMQHLVEKSSSVWQNFDSEASQFIDWIKILADNLGEITSS
jgi:uncharacterized protein YutE (UPF0331/DUF86 family)